MAVIPVILPTQEVEIRRIVVQRQIEQKVSKTPSQHTSQVRCYIPVTTDSQVVGISRRVVV
jgi:hypothetical protein